MPTVLAIESHVVHGYVGNKAATFPLQLRGWDVDALNTVQFSNHTGYGYWEGRPTPANEIQAIYAGLRKHDFVFDAVLSGYVRSADGVAEVGKIGRDIVSRFPNAIWVLDPVMGDEGSLYVTEEVVPAYQDTLKAGSVTVVTPNGFEAETLTDIKLVDFDAVKKCLEKFHSTFRVPNVLISSVAIDGKLYAVGSTEGETPFYIELQEIKSYFTGTGDLFAALLLDNFYHSSQEKGSRSLPDAAASTVATMQHVLTATFEYCTKSTGSSAVRGEPKSMKSLELRIIPLRNEIATAPSKVPEVHLL